MAESVNKNQKIPKHLYDSLVKMSKENNLSVTALVNIAIAKWLRTQKMFK